MKISLNRLKCAVVASLTMAFAYGAAAENVAEVTIGETTTGYATIDDAWSACNGQNATLKLLANVDITSALNKSWYGEGQDLSLDLNGHTLNQTGSGRIISMNGNLTVENGILTRSGASFSGNGAGIIVCHNGANDEGVLTRLVMRGVTMTNCVATSNGGAIYAERDTQVLLENCTLRQNAAGGSGGAIYTEGGATETKDTAKDPWDRLVLISTVITDNTAGTSGAGVYYKYTVKGASCFVAGTLVRMADGNEKAIEEVEEGDIVRTFDHEGGTNSTAKVFLTVKEPITTQIFVLTFADGYGVRCVLSHDFLMKDGDTCRYVCLSRQNAADFVGKSFYAADGQWHKLLSVTDGETVDEVYEIYTSQHLNSYADGLLTVPADVAHVLNIYKLGADLKADAEQLAADVAAYGLADYEEMSTKYGMSRAWYDDVNVKYGYVIVGKGLMTLAQIEALYKSTQEGGADGDRALPKTAALPKLTTESNESDPLADCQASKLTLGAGTIVTNNLVGTTPNNIYLEKSTAYSLIALAKDCAGICAGVTPQWTTGQITEFNYANPGDIALFRSDNADYAVWYAVSGEGSFLKLAEGSQIVPPAVANTTYEIWKDGERIAQNEGTSVIIKTNVKVVYAAAGGYFFDGSGVTTKEVGVDTSKSIATMTPPDAPFYAVAKSEKTDGGSSVTSYHSSLAAAVDAIGADGTGTVTMLADVTMAETGAAWVPDGSDLTLDLAGKKIDWTTSNGDSILYFAADTDGKLTIMDSGVGGTISTYCNSSEVTNSALIVYCAGNGDLTVSGGTFVCSNKVGAATLFFKNGTGDWAFNGGTYKAQGEGAGGAHFLYCGAAKGTTSIAGGTYDISATASAAAGVGSNAECFDKITIKGGDFDVVTKGAWGGAFSCGNGTMLVNGGDFCVTSSVAGVSCILAERRGTTILSNGTFRAVTTDGYAYAACATEKAALTIAGGAYSSKASIETAATVVGKEQSTVTIVGSPVISNGETDGTAWNLAVQLWGAHLDFSGYTGANLPSLAVFADGTYGVSYVTGEMTKFGNAWIWAGYFSTYPNDGWVQDGRRAFANTDEQTKAAYPWFIDDTVTFTPAAVGNTTATVYTNGAAMAAAGSYTLQINAANVKVVYTATDGYVFGKDGATAVTNEVSTVSNPATADVPDAPFVPAASVTANGVTTLYGTLTGAWADATNAQHKSVNARVTLLANATVEATLRTSENGVLTLDLNDHVLAYVGENDESIIHRWASTLHVVDTAQTRTPRYFTCDETGLWTLTDEVTDRVVWGGLLTGGRAGAITHESNASGGPHTISNVNFVGNWTDSNGGAVLTPTTGMELKIASSSFLGNVTTGNGGAIYAAGPCEMTDCRVEANVADGWGGGLYLKYKGSLVRTEVVGNKAGTGGGVYLTCNPGGCFPAGVKILMADGSEKAVEEVAEGDVVATFDHVGGTNSSAAVFYVYRGTGAQNVFTLSFASGAKLDVADRHDLLLEATRKYVTVSADNARMYLGKRFYNYATGGWDELTGVTAAKDCDAHYSLYVRGHANCVANGMLTVPDDKDCFINVYELDANLKADAAQLAADIAAYGLAKPADYPNVPLDDFEDGNVRYAPIAIGKGLTTQAEILYWNEFDYGPVVTKKANSALKLLTSTDAVAAPAIPYLQVGEGVVVTGNVNATGADNVYLQPSEVFGTAYNPVIDILPETANLNVGVTLSTYVGVFGWTNETDYASSFFSDNPSYSIIYTADKTLELVALVTIMPKPVANTTFKIYVDGVGQEEASVTVRMGTPAYVVYAAAGGYVFTNGLATVTYGCDTSVNPALVESPDALRTSIAEVVVERSEKTEVPPAEKPQSTDPEIWAAATNMASEVVVVNGMGLVSESEVTNIVTEVKRGDTEKVTVEVQIVVTPKDAKASVGNSISEMTVDVSPLLITTVKGEDTVVTTNGIENGASPVLVVFDVSLFERAPVVIAHRHGGETKYYAAGDAPSLTTFAYDAETATASMLMQEFSDVVIYSWIPVGDTAWADISDGRCVIKGNGDMWSYEKARSSALWIYRDSITNLVVESGITSVGSRFFEDMWWLRDVLLGEDVTSVGARAFKKCYGLTNVTSVAKGAPTVGDYVFSGCHSLQAMSFAGTTTFGAECYSLYAAIEMDGDIPRVYPIPQVKIGDRYNALRTMGKVKFEDEKWDDVTDLGDDERKAYHFFKIVIP